MKKILIAVPLVAGVGAAAIAGTSQYAGTQTQTQYQQLLAQFNELSPLLFVNEIYESGLSKSVAITKVMASRAADAEVVFRLSHDIDHAAVRMDEGGLTLGKVSIDSVLHDKTSIAPEFVAAFTDDMPFRLRTDVSYGGDITHQLNVSGIEISEEGKVMSWSGVTFEGVTREGATTGTGSMGTLDINNVASGESVTVADSPFSVDFQHHGNNIYTGTGQLAFNNVTLMNPEMPVPVSMDSVTIDSNTVKNSDKLTSTTRIELAGIESPLPLNEASVDLEIAGLDIEGLRQYNSLMNSINVDPEAVLADPEFATKVTSTLRNVVQPGSAMSYAIALSNDEGDVNTNLRVAIKDVSDDGMSADALDNIVTGRDLLNILSVKGALDADTQALAQTPVLMMLGGVADFVTVTDESITSDVSLNGTTLVINAVELPLDVLSGGLLDIPLSELMQM